MAAVCSIYLDFRAAVQASCQQLPGLDGDRCQLPLFFQNVSNGVDVGHTGLLFVVDWNFSISADPQVSSVTALGGENGICAPPSPDSKT